MKALTSFATAFAVLLLLASARPAQATPAGPPVSTMMELMDLPTAGSNCTVLWGAYPEFTPTASEIDLMVTNLTTSEKTTQHLRVSLEKGKVYTNYYTFLIPKAGDYRVEICVTMHAPLNQFAQDDALFIHVPEKGRGSLYKEPVGSAKEMMDATVKSQKRPAFDDKFKPKTGGIQLAVLQTGPFTVSGTMKYSNQLYTTGSFTGWAFAPARRIKVEITDIETTRPNILLGTTITDNAGNFSFNVPNNIDNGNNGRDIRVRLITDGTMTSVVDTSSNIYFYDLPTVTNWQGGNMNLNNVTIGASPPQNAGNIPQANSGPFNIFDVATRGLDYATARGVTTLVKLTLMWAVGYNPPSGTAFFRTTKKVDVSGIVANPDEFDDDIILHEFGHYVADKISYTTGGGPHTMLSHIGQDLAWSEGQAHMFSSLVRNFSFQVDHRGGGANFMTTDFEKPEYLYVGGGSTLNNMTGSDNEASVCAVLWDIYDSNSDNRDILFNGVANYWSILSNTTYFASTRGNTILDFIDGWVLQNKGSLYELSEIFGEHQLGTAAILYPSAAGITLYRGMTYPISFSGVNPASANVKFELVKKTVVQSTIVASTPNNGTYNWIIPNQQAPADDYRVKVSTLTGLSDFDFSDKLFKIASPLTVTYPTSAGLTLNQGISSNITWTSVPAVVGANVKIELMKGAVVSRVIIASTPNNGTFAWLVPADVVAAGDYKVRISSVTTPNVLDLSDNNFAVDAAITVTDPNGGNSVLRGLHYSVKWTSAPSLGNVKIELLKGAAVNLTISASAPNNGTFDWTVPAAQTLGSDYKIKITAVSNATFTDSSNNNFSVVQPITVTYPTAEGIGWTQGNPTVYTIHWSSSAAVGANVKIELYKGAALNRTIIASTPNNGSYAYLVPADVPVGTDYKVKISTLDGVTSDMSVFPFAVTAQMQVLTPSATGITWLRNKDNPIKWASNSALGAYVKIELLKGGAVNTVIQAETFNDGTYGWIVPGTITPGSDYKIRVTVTTNAGLTDTSDNPFTIQ